MREREQVFEQKTVIFILIKKYFLFEKKIYKRKDHSLKIIFMCFGVELSLITNPVPL